jgi:hypothetical protein
MSAALMGIIYFVERRDLSIKPDHVAFLPGYCQNSGLHFQ